MMPKPVNILITGGAGFIGSHLVEKYINDNRVALVRVVDNLATGKLENIKEHLSHSKFEYVEGDICDWDLCMRVTKDIDKISHQAALGSVSRSISDPLRTINANVNGSLNILYAAHLNNVERVVIACSSSAYGDSEKIPKKETDTGRPLSPYAATKYAVEVFADVFQRTYGLNYIGLRYFNVFGPRQDSDSSYAAVIPIFCKAFIQGEKATINGDGLTSRDFTYITNAIHANDLSLFSENTSALNKVYNVACGEQTTLVDVISTLRNISGKNIVPYFGKERAGDIKHSKADITKIKELLHYDPQVRFNEGLQLTYNWYNNSVSHLHK